ncbi:unnamed protein product, partial [Heterosigma akashiwo]
WSSYLRASTTSYRGGSGTFFRDLTPFKTQILFRLQ